MSTVERGFYREDDISNKIYEFVEYQPDLVATGLTYVETPIFGSYVKNGKMVFIRILVECDKITNFGSNGYTITLPFDAAAHTGVIGGMAHDISTGKKHFIMGQTEKDSNVLTMYHLDNQVELAALEHDKPFVFASGDFWHIEGWYEVTQ